MSIAEKINFYCWNCKSHDCRFCRFNPGNQSIKSDQSQFTTSTTPAPRGVETVSTITHKSQYDMIQELLTGE